MDYSMHGIIAVRVDHDGGGGAICEGCLFKSNQENVSAEQVHVPPALRERVTELHDTCIASEAALRRATHLLGSLRQPSVMPSLAEGRLNSLRVVVSTLSDKESISKVGLGKEKSGRIRRKGETGGCSDECRRSLKSSNVAIKGGRKMIDQTKLSKRGPWFIIVQPDSQTNQLMVSAVDADTSLARRLLKVMLVDAQAQFVPKLGSKEVLDFVFFDSNVLEHQKPHQRASIDVEKMSVEELASWVKNAHLASDLLDWEVCCSVRDAILENLRKSNESFSRKMQIRKQMDRAFQEHRQACAKRFVLSGVKRPACKSHAMAAGDPKVYNWASLMSGLNSTFDVDYHTGLAEAARLPLVPGIPEEWDFEAASARFNSEVDFLWRLHSRVACLGAYHMECRSMDRLRIEVLQVMCNAWTEANAIMSMAWHGMNGKFSDSSRKAWVEECELYGVKVMGSNWVLWDRFKKSRAEPMKIKNGIPIPYPHPVIKMFGPYGDLFIDVYRFQTGYEWANLNWENRLSIVEKALGDVVFGNTGALNSAFDSLAWNRVMDTIALRPKMDGKRIAVMTSDRPLLAHYDMLEEYKVVQKKGGGIELKLPGSNADPMARAWGDANSRIAAIEDKEGEAVWLTRFVEQTKAFSLANLERLHQAARAWVDNEVPPADVAEFSRQITLSFACEKKRTQLFAEQLGYCLRKLGFSQ